MLNSSQYISNTSREYSLYVAQNRAIPNFVDGLKDSQRKALWVVRNQAEKIKVISLSGAMINSNLYLHGDTSASSAISNLAAPFLNNLPFLDGIGNFGTRSTPSEFGAPRYVYVKRNSALQKIMLADLETIPMKENYDGSVMEPVCFVPLIPTVLLNGVKGIAVGWSTEIQPRDPKEVVSATRAAVLGKKIPKLLPTFTKYNCKVVETPDGWEVEGVCEKTDSSTVVITELPPDLSLEKFKDRLNTFEDAGKINSYIDKSSKTIHIIIKFKRGTIADWSNQQIIDFLKLKSRLNERIVTLDQYNNKILQYSTVDDLIVDFVKIRLNQYVLRYQNLLSISTENLDLLNAIKKLFEVNFPSELNSLEDKPQVKDRIRHHCGAVSEQHCETIANRAGYMWTKNHYTKCLEDIQTEQNAIKEFKDLLNDPEAIKTVYLKELDSIKI